VIDPERRLSVLLAEDSSVQRLAITELLEAHGYAVRGAADGVEALRALQLGKALPDAVIADIGMPNMNGINLCRHIKRDDKTSRLPVIVLTSLEGERNQHQAIEAGADEFLLKPVHANELLLRLESVLSRAERGSSDELRRQRELFEAIADAVVVTNDSGHYLEANSAALQMLGYSRSELMKLDSRTLSLQTNGAWLESHRQLRSAGTWRGQDRMRSKDGRTIAVEAHARRASLGGQRVFVAVLRKVI
jgi:PAS domain S-box-containing protein